MKTQKTSTNIITFYNKLNEGIVIISEDGEINYNNKFKSWFSVDSIFIASEMYHKFISDEVDDFKYQFEVDYKVQTFEVSKNIIDSNIVLIVKEVSSTNRFIYVVDSGDDLFHKVFNTSYSCYILTDSKGKVHRVNRKFETTFVDTVHKIIGEDLGKWFEIAENIELKVGFEMFLRGKEEIYEYVGRIKDHDNKFRWCKIAVLWVNDELKQNILVNITDITQQHHAERELKESKKTLTSVLSNMPGMAYKVNYSNNKKIEFLSRGVYDLLGYHVEDFLYQNNNLFFSLVPKNYRLEVKEAIDEAINKSSNFSFVFPMTHKDGRTVWVWEQGKITDDNGSVYLEGFLTDVSDRVLAERALKESEQRLELSLEGAELGMWDYNVLTGEIVLDGQENDIFNYPFDKISTIYDVERIIHPDDIFNYRKKLFDHISGKTPFFECEARMKSSEGKWHWILSKGKVFDRNDKGSPIRAAGTFLNIDERKSNEITIMNAIVETQEEERTRFAKDLHDGLGQYLAAIKMNFNSFLSQDSIDEIRINQLNDLINQAIKDLRTVSHNLMPGSVSDLGVTDALKELLKPLENVGYRLEFNENIGDRRFQPNIEINIYRVCQEMINNTVKHADASKIELSLFKQKNKLNIVYQDNGQGIEELKMDKEGIGLKNMKSRIYSLNGTIEIISEKGKGYTAEIVIPIKN